VVSLEARMQTAEHIGFRRGRTALVVDGRRVVGVDYGTWVTP
jgi:hypothetical protein